MRTRLWLFLALASCSRDLSVPPDPQPGRVTGRVVYAVPGRSDLRPAGGASITLLGSSLAATANQAGTFTLAPLEQTEGLLLFRFDSDGDGVLDRQRTERLEDWHTGTFKQVDMGDVALGENASIHGRVLLADQPGAKSGLGGSAVFVPEGPFTAYTADDGSYTLSNLPPGPIQIVVFRATYTPKSLGTVDLRPAEDFGARDVVLEKSTTPMAPGTITGALAFSPTATGKGDSAVAAGPFTGTVADDLGFRIEGVAPALYTVRATRTGYTAAQVPNVLVLPGQTAALGVVLVTDQPLPDAGVPPQPPDAGPPDAGSTDGGTDAGFADGGVDGGACVGPGCKPCTTNAQCGLTEWCDAFRCVPQCSATETCTNGRACDSATGTCVVACDGGCQGANEVCFAGICRSACSGSFPCPAGQVCGGNQACGPECSVTVPCALQHLTCSGGQCVPKSTCGNDLDCAPSAMCLLGLCKVRPTPMTDAGVYTCTGACQCRLGEWCTGGLCRPDLTPTLWFAADGGGTGASRASPSSDLGGKLAQAAPNTVLGLRADDRFYRDEGFVIAADRITVAGGFVDCQDDRWVRSDATRTVLAADAGVVLSATGTAAFPLEDTTLSNLEVQTASVAGCDDSALTLTDMLRPRLLRIEGGLEAVNDCSGQAGNTTALVSCIRCTEALLEDVRLESTATRKNVLLGVELFQSSGIVRRLVVDPPLGVHSTFLGISVDQQQGEVRIEDSRFPEVTAGGAGTYGVYGTACGAHLFIVERSTFAFAKSPLSQNSAAGIRVNGCRAMELRDNVFDGAQLTGTLYPNNSGIELTNAGGVVERNTLRLPRAVNPVAVRGISFVTGADVLTIRDNTITGGGGPTVEGMELSYSAYLVDVMRNTVDVGPGTTVRGAVLSVMNSRFSDNSLRATGDGSCVGSAIGLTLSDARGVFERNRLFGAKSVISRGFSSSTTGTVSFEVYASHLWAGPAACLGESTAMTIANHTTPAGAWLAANTLDVEATPTTNSVSQGLACTASQVWAEGNVIGSGGAPTRKAVFSNAAECITPANWSRNHLWLDHASPAYQAGDGIQTVAGADAGLPDVMGNVFNGNVSPFDAVQPVQPDGGALPRHRPVGPLVVDRPPLTKRKDLTDVWLDLDRRPRDAGAGPDLGCCERY